MLDKFVIRREPLAARTIEGEGVIITLADKQVHHFNASATMVFEHVDGRRSVRDLIAALCQAFEVPVERATEDVIRLVGELEAKGIVRLSDEPAPPTKGETKAETKGETKAET